MRIRIRPRFIVVLVLLMALLPLVRADDELTVAKDHARRMQDGLALFKAKVRPVLVQHCLNCHGGQTTKGDLDLSDREPLVKSGVLEGGGKESRLTVLIRHEDEPHMPQKGAKLPEGTIAEIARWIDLGAPYDRPLIDQAPGTRSAKGPTADKKDFWSFRPLKTSAPPLVQDSKWARTPIDRFILGNLEQRSLKPNSLADRRTLIRRVTFDLTGLPPTPEEIESFVHDPASEAYERLVDRLLASPGYGERSASYWMDVARFAESHGYEQDYDRPFAFHYRDYLIRAFNGDMPYDQFVQWQLSGDEMAPGDPMAMAATGFLGAGAFPTQLTEAEFESARYNELDDMVATTGVAFLGLSVGCARCHDHKYDPIMSEDYYRMAAVFTSTIRSEVEVSPGTGAKPVKMQITAEGYPHTSHHADDRGFPHFYPKTYLLRRGDVAQKVSEATPGVLRVLTSQGANPRRWKIEPTAARRPQSSYRRAALAAWITDTEYGAGPLTARVMVNRVWQHHFGQGIVATPNDFGSQGSRPSHPELLDWLASALIKNGWRLKPIHRLILTSAVYMQGSQFDELRAVRDRENVFYWRHTPRRLEAEPIRDAMLASAGRLDRRMHGPGSLDVEMPRRSVYFFIKRSRLIPMMMLFDWPEHLVSIGQRSTTTTAPQALSFLNSDLARHCGEGLATRVRNAGDPHAAVTMAYRIAFGRAPIESEYHYAEQFLTNQLSAYSKEHRPDPYQSALVDFCQALIGMNEFIYIP